jgi:DNA polymerase-3 subunit delta'
MLSPERLQRAVEWFETGVSSGRPAHAYMVIGAPRGEAREFVLKALACLFRTGGKKTTDLAAHPDVLWIEPQKKSRVTSVDQIREARHRMTQTAFVGPWKVCVLVAADRMTDAASNAFLKTLEEPPGQSIFFLLTDRPEALLPTVVSRCQRIVLSSGELSLRPEWQKALMGILSKGDESFLSGMLRARHFTRLLADIKATVESEVFEAADQGEEKEALEARAEAAYREVRDDALRLLSLWYRDILLCVCGADEKRLFHASFCAEIRRKASGLSHAVALRRVDVIENMKKQFDGNLKEEAVFTLAFDRLYGGA